METIGRGLNVFYKGKKVFWTLECIQSVKKCVCNKKNLENTIALSERNFFGRPQNEELTNYNKEMTIVSLGMYAFYKG